MNTNNFYLKKLE